MNKFIPLSVPNLKGNAVKYVSETVESEWVSTGGSCIEDFEKKVAEYVKAPGAVACQSGTAGLHLALLACGVQAGEEVITPTLTFIASVNPIKYVGAEPVFMDCDDTLCMDMDKVNAFCATECTMKDGRLINNKTQKHVSAMVVVHIFGNIADMDKAVAISKKYNLILIEDACEALGSYITEGQFKGKFAGTIGDIGVFSFNGNKIITTGGGGMIVSNNAELLKETKYLSTQAKDDMLYFVHKHIGYNYRMTNMQAALGLSQMELLEDYITIKNENYKEYQSLSLPLLPFRSDIRTNAWFYSFMTEKRDELIKGLSERHIQARPIWYLISELDPYLDCQKYKIEKAKYYWERVVNIPCSTNLEKEEIKTVVSEIKSIVG